MVLVSAVYVCKNDLIAGTSDGNVLRFTAAGDCVVLGTVDGSPVTSVAGSTKGDRIIAGTKAGGVSVFTATDTVVHYRLEGLDAIDQIHEIDPRKHVLLTDHRRAYLSYPDKDNEWCLNSIVKPDGVRDVIDQVEVSADKRRLVLRWSFQWKFWDLMKNRITEEYQPFEPAFLAYEDGVVGLAPAGKYYFVYWDEYMVYDTEKRIEIRNLQATVKPSCGTLTADARRLALGDDNGRLAVVGSDGNHIYDERVRDERIVQVVLSSHGDKLGWRDASGKAGLIEVDTGRRTISV